MLIGPRCGVWRCALSPESLACTPLARPRCPAPRSAPPRARPQLVWVRARARRECHPRASATAAAARRASRTDRGGAATRGTRPTSCSANPRRCPPRRRLLHLKVGLADLREHAERHRAFRDLPAWTARADRREPAGHSELAAVEQREQTRAQQRARAAAARRPRSPSSAANVNARARHRLRASRARSDAINRARDHGLPARAPAMRARRGRQARRRRAARRPRSRPASSSAPSWTGGRKPW